MSIAMVYTPAITQEHTATEKSWAAATQQPSRSGIQKRSNNGISIAHPEPVVKRTVTVQDLSYPEPMQGLLIIQSDSEDDDDNDDNERISSSSSSSSSSNESQYDHTTTKTPLVETTCNQQVKSKKKPLPPVPLFVPDLHGDTTFDHQQQQQEQEVSVITPESPFLMIPTPLEPIQESLDSTIEDEVALYKSDDDDDDDDTTSASNVAHDEKTTTENVSSDDCKQHDTITALEAPAITHQSDIVSLASSTHTQKPFEPGPAQTPHTPEEAQPATIWSVDNSSSSIRTSDEYDQHSLRRRASKEELPPPINTQLTSNVSLCSRCSSISSAPSSAVSMLSNQDLLRAAAAASTSHIPRTASAISLGSAASSSRPMSHAWEPHQQPLMLPHNTSMQYNNHQQPLAFHMQQQQPSPVASPLHKAQSTPHLATTTAANNAAVVDALLQPVPVKSRLSIASFSLTHDKDAIKTYRRMASKTHNKAIQLTYAKYLLDVARLYKSNQSTRERLLSEAGYWIERLAKAGLAEALFIKGKWHLQQPEIEECDPSYRNKPQPLKAYKCFQAAARAGWVDAYYELARYQKSRGEYTRAVDCYKLAASKGHTLATYKMAKILLRGQLHQKRNIKLGLDYLQKAADALDDDSAEPAYVLSCVYADELERIGIARESQMSRENIPLAIFYLKKAAQTGLPMAVHRMGQVHEHGLLNLPRDAWQGYSCYVRAAEDGHEGAMLDLSRLYAQGIAGYLMPQYEIAFKWCQRAADKGLEQAEYVLGTYYEDGIGTLPDYPRALEYFSKAASKGYAPAEEKLNVPTTSFATGASSSTQLSSENASSKLSSLRIKRQPAAERPTNDDDDFSPSKLENKRSSHIPNSTHSRKPEPSPANCFIM
ncbi:HCP-like protein [Lichtheimia hyalospora FSU 10163]|nr:HCP-like protein [Lichtheimia hyalospora FSU 10163]